MYKVIKPLISFRGIFVLGCVVFSFLVSAKHLYTLLLHPDLNSPIGRFSLTVGLTIVIGYFLLAIIMLPAFYRKIQKPLRPAFLTYLYIYLLPVVLFSVMLGYSSIGWLPDDVSVLEYREFSNVFDWEVILYFDGFWFLFVVFLVMINLVGLQHFYDEDTDFNSVGESILFKIFTLVIPYLLIGLFFSACWGMVYISDSSSIRGCFNGVYDVIYFSFVTLTTLGYGDHTPVSTYSKILVVVETIIGVFYMSLIVGVVIGSFFQKATAGQNNGNTTHQPPSPHS